MYSLKSRDSLQYGRSYRDAVKSTAPPDTTARIFGIDAKGSVFEDCPQIRS